MSTFFLGEGNICSKPEFRSFPNGNNPPRTMMRLNVRFDNPVPKDGGYEDRGGFFAPVEIWHSDAEHWSENIYQRGMRILVEGRTVMQEWEDNDKKPRLTFKIEARRIAILPNRVVTIVMKDKPSQQEPENEPPEL
ncbi:single-stranded DNA-binding protein [Zophobihabitans entericus]|uniref:Single-stranded DNA-binding protein n=1 Tax=Zophobihabitans entericus TaxID=1635327 RepID=A0A6G9ID16_9GAMM|nr:single-stranded DNA-binding protein [Zophobihabitans entericus]QIQ22128.1 single-stranded DNA-binding protein [Zophobihabitans entericus]